MLEHDPDTLVNLAVDAFGDYLTTVVQNWQDATTGIDSEWMQWFAGNVHAALGNAMLPSHLANEVTVRLLRQLDKCIDGKIRMDPYLSDSYLLATSHLTSAVVHPAVTHLDLMENETYYTYFRVAELLSQYVCEMNMLKVLKLQEIPFNIVQFSLPNLQELTLVHECSDCLLKLLLVTCGNIRKIDVTRSGGVTDAGVQFLAKFTFLESVNVMKTSISDEGLTQLLTDLSKNKDSEGVSLMKSLGCCELNPEQLQLLVDNFHNLVDLQAEHISNFDFSLLRNLKHLQSLTSTDSEYNLEKILEIIGHQLKKLEYYSWCDVTPFDPCCIFKHCPSLISLHLDISNCHLRSSEMTPQANFKSLQVVDVTVEHTLSDEEQSIDFLSRILSHCTNVRVLRLKCYEMDSNPVATAMLRNNPLEHLEELHWWSHSGKETLLPEVGRQIVSQCKNLKLMYSNIWWTRRRNRKPWFNYLVGNSKLI